MLHSRQCRIREETCTWYLIPGIIYERGYDTPLTRPVVGALVNDVGEGNGWPTVVVPYVATRGFVS